MRRYSLILWVSLVLNLSLSAQIKILYVDDSDDVFLNAETIYDAIIDVGYSAKYFNALDSADLLTFEYLANYDLVIWQTSNDGTKLSLWNEDDTENNEIKTYLENGGNLWIGGLDFLFDKYGTPPQAFEKGSFVYDFMGLQSYDCQSYGNDGGKGVPFVVPEDTSIIQDLVPLKWNFPTLWWVDGITPRQEAHVIYRMSGDNYIFDQKVCGVLYSGANYNVFSSFFDLGVAFDFELMKMSVLPVLDFFDSKMVNSSYDQNIQHDVRLFPNPVAHNIINIEFGKLLVPNQKVEFKLFDIYGHLISTLDDVLYQGASHNSYQLKLPNSSTGLFYVQINADHKIITKSFVRK